MQLEHKYIYMVYQEGSISKAAEKLFITQPALSIAIQRVENSLGLPIFDRSQRPITLTPAGRAYIHMIKETQYLEEEFQQQLYDMQELNTGKITIGGSHYLNAYILPKCLAVFTNKYPNIVIELEEHGSSVIAEMLSEHKVDLTFNCDPLLVKEYENYPAFKDTVLLAVPERHPINCLKKDLALSAQDVLEGKHLLSSCPTVNLSAFRDLSYVLLSQGNNLYERSMQLFKEAGFEPKVKLSISQLVTAYHLAENGFAAAFVSDRLVTGAETKLKFYKLDSDVIQRQFYILLPKRKYTSLATRKFIEYFMYGQVNG